MSEYYDGGSMHGSGIDSETVEFEGFVCKDTSCLHHNQAGYVSTNDHGDYTVECESCGTTESEGNLKEERFANNYYGS